MSANSAGERSRSAYYNDDCIVSARLAVWMYYYSAKRGVSILFFFLSFFFFCVMCEVEDFASVKIG